MDLTIEEASFLAGINEKTIYRIEHGINQISRSTLDKLSIAYRKDLFDIYNRYISNPETKLSNLINETEKSLYIDNLKNIEVCINEFKKLPLRQFTSYKKVIIKYYVRLLEATYIDLKYRNRLEAVNLLIDSIKSEIYNFQIRNYKNFNYNPIEKRILMNISTMIYGFHEDKIYIEILTHLLALLDSDYILYPKLILNLSTLHHKRKDYKESIYLTNKGIDYCIQHKSLDVLPKFFFRKFTSEVELDMESHKDSLKKAIFMAEVNNQEYIKNIFITNAKKIYGVTIN